MVAAAGLVVASADREEVGHMAEVVVLESVAPDGAITEVALEAGLVDQEAVDMEVEEADTAMGSVEPQWA